MRKMFNRSKSHVNEEEDPNRAQLFGSRNKNPSPAPQSLAPSGASPYANNNYNTAAPTKPAYNNNVYANGGGSGASNQGYNNNSYGGARGGYNEPTTYGGAPEPTSYGGAPESKSYGAGTNYTSRAPINRHDSTSTVDSNREALFGNRQQQQLLMKPAPPQDTYSGAEATGAGAYAQSDGYSSTQRRQQPQSNYNSVSDPYDTGENRQLTAEEEEDEDVDALKQQIRFTKQESVASTQNALRAAQQAEETGRNTLIRLGEQGEKLHNTEVNLSLAKNHGRIAEAKARELKTLNRSMFAVHVANPFNSQSRAQEKEQQILKQQQIDRDEKEQNRAGQFDSRQRVGGTLAGTQPGAKPRQKMSLAEKARFQYEADEEDDAMEDEINNNLDLIGDAAGRLKQLALATNKEVDNQNKRIADLGKQTDIVDDQIALNTNRLKRFGA